MTDPLAAVFALLHTYQREKRTGRVEIVFAGGSPKHIHEHRVTQLPQNEVAPFGVGRPEDGQ